MAWTDIPTRSSSDLNAAADINALQGNCEYLLDGRLPVGSFYTQYPSAETNTKTTAFPTADEPGELFSDTTWTQLYDDEGLFFKTEGDPLSQTDGENNARTTGLQTDAMQGHYHYLADTTGGGASQALVPITSRTLTPATPIQIQNVLSPTTDGTNGTPRTGKETRPRNRLVKIWYRTA